VDAAARGSAQLDTLQPPDSAGADGTQQLAAALQSLLARGADDGTATAAVGRAGEAYVARLLAAAPEYASAHVRWVNATAETGLPCDIEIVLPDAADASDNGCRVYVEVKTTTAAPEAARARVFDISPAELDWARSHGPRYHLCRVLAQPAAPPRVLRVVDPAAALARGGARLLMQI
jgi:hypothetical protein